MTYPAPDAVLNTVTLPSDIDDRLRVKAHREGRPKGDIIREAVERHLADLVSFREDLRRPTPGRR